MKQEAKMNRVINVETVLSMILLYTTVGTRVERECRGLVGQLFGMVGKIFYVGLIRRRIVL